MFKRKKSAPDAIPTRRSPSGSGPTVFSYYARGSSTTGQNLGRTIEREEPITSKRLRTARFSDVSSLLALLLIFIVVLYSLWIQPKPKIVVVAHSNTIYQDMGAYQKAIDSVWGADFGNQFKLTVNAKALERQITAVVPDIAYVQVQLPLLGRKPTVILTPGQPALELLTVNGGFFVDTAGKVMARSKDIKQNQLQDIPSVQDESGLKADPGKIILTNQQATFIHTLARQLTAEGLRIQSMTLPANAVNQVDVRLNGQPYYIKFATTGEARQAVGTYLTAKNKFSTEGVTPAEYVDVRIDEKVFYK